MADKTNIAKKGIGLKIPVLAAVVIIAALAAIGYYGGFFGSLATPPNPTVPLATPEARLLLASYDRGAELSSYSLNWSVSENGVWRNYAAVKNGSDSWVLEQGAFGKMYGFFGKDNATDLVCLEYGGETKCALTGNQSDMADIAAGLKIWRPNPIASLGQKDETRKLIAVGVIKFKPGMASEAVGDFNTQKIAYVLDYSNLTVQQMVSLGVSPNNANPLDVVEVTIWIDNRTGLLVKSHASYSSLGVPQFYDGLYTGVSTVGGTIPQRPGIVATEAFVDFYSKSTQDYSERAACLAKKGAEQDTCFKSIAANNGDWETCKLIKTPFEYESCSIIVAQETKNAVICGKLATLSDECYISVAGETGNFELCRNVKNMSLSLNCIEAATAGQKKYEAAATIAANAYAARNCAEDAGCKAFGNQGQYCAPKNSTAQFADGSSPVHTCLAGVRCGCLEGYCGFAKNETYYSCMNRVEDEELRAYINGLIPDNSTITNVTEKIGIG